MAVFTQVSDNEARKLLRQLQLGELHALRGIEGGIENTNYFVTCDEGEFVLTLFERLTAEQLPFYLHLMKHLAHMGIPVPDPRANKAGDILHTVCGKPAAVVNRLAGRSQLAPEAVHCAAVGGMLARMHLPRGPVHADLFRDNVMFEGAQLTGFFDFYFAGVDSFLFDLAVCLNDWCIDLPTGAHDAHRATAMIDAYQVVRALTAAERSLLPARAGALRFWVSRLWDYYLPREASMLTPHDPSHFERVLRQRARHPVTL